MRSFLEQFKFKTFLLFFLPMLLVAGVARADAVAGGPAGTGDFATWVAEIVADAPLWGTVGIVGIVGLVLKLLTDFLNINFVSSWFDTLPASVQLIVVHVLAFATAGVTILANHGTVWQALGASIIAAGAAVYLNELLSNLLGINISISPAASAVSAAPAVAAAAAAAASPPQAAQVNTAVAQAPTPGTKA